MYPFTSDSSQSQQHSNTPHRVQSQPHPLNPNFRFPPLPPAHHTPQRSISQPQPQPQLQQQSLGHNRRPTLNPETSLFTYRPLEVLSPLDNGFQRLKRYHDDPSALGVDFTGPGVDLGQDSRQLAEGESCGQHHSQVVSPRRKAALAHTLAYGTLDKSQTWNEQTMHPAEHAAGREPPPQFTPFHRTAPSVSPIPRVNAPSPSMSGSRYLDDRSSLGVAHSLRTSPIPEQPHLIIPNPGTGAHMQTPPQMIRAWTLDSSSRTSLSPLAHSHESLPLTMSPLGHSQTSQGHLLSGQISPSHSATSAPPMDGKRYRSEPTRRMSFYSPNIRNRDRDLDDEETDRRYRGFKGREGGPPKAKLGGAGGKTYDEMVAARSPGPNTPAVEKVGMETPSRTNSTGEYKWKGNPINIKLPPERYSPPDSPPKLLPAAAGTNEVQPVQPEPKLPRKEAYPWPGHKVRLSATGTPLPLSPGEPGVDTVRRPSVASTVVTEDSREGLWRGKEVLVSIPDEGCWDRLRPPTPEPEPESEPQAEGEGDIDVGVEPEAEVSAVLRPLPLSDQEDNDSRSSRSVDVVEDTVPSVPSELGQMTNNDMFADSAKMGTAVSWDELPDSPIKTILTPPKLPLDDSADGSSQYPSDEGDAKRKNPLFSLIPHPSLPAKPITREDPPPYLSPGTEESTSRSKRTFSIKGLVNNDFLKRSLGEILKAPDDNTTSTPGPAPKRRRDAAVFGSDASVALSETSQAAHGEISEGPKISIIGQLKKEKEREDEFEDIDLTPLQTYPSKMRAWRRSPSPPRPSTPDAPDDSIDHPDMNHAAEGEPTNRDSDNEESQPAEPGTMRAWTPSPALSDRSFSLELSERPPIVGRDEQARPVLTSPSENGTADKQRETGSKMRAWTPSPSVTPAASPPLHPQPPLSDVNSVASAEEILSKPPAALGAQSRSDPPYEKQESVSRLRAWTPSPDPSPSSSGTVDPFLMGETESSEGPASDMRPGLNDTIPSPEAEELSYKTKNVVMSGNESRPTNESPSCRKDVFKRGRSGNEDAKESGPGAAERPTTLEKARLKALASRKSKRRAEDEGSLSTNASSPASHDRSPVLEEMQRRVIESRERKGISFVQRPLGGLLKGSKPSPVPSDLDRTATDSAQASSNAHQAEAFNGDSEEDHTNKFGSRVDEERTSSPTNTAKRLRPTAVVFQPPSTLTINQSPKRLRPTAEAWRPPRSLTLGKRPSFGAIGLTAKQQILPSSQAVPNLTPSAAPFVPRSTSFTWLPPQDSTIVQRPFVPIAPAFVPRSTSFNLPPPVQQLGSTGQGHGNFTFAYPPNENAANQTKPKGESLNSSSSKLPLKASAPNFVPFEFGAAKDIDTSGTRHLRTGSVASGTGAGTNSQLKLRAVAAAYTPSFELAKPQIPNVNSMEAAAHDTLSPVPILKDEHSSLPSTSAELSENRSPAPQVPAETDLPSHHSSERLSRINSQDFVRPPSITGQPILSPADSRFQEQQAKPTPQVSEPDGRLGRLGVIQRGRADTVAFGPLKTLSRDDVGGDASDEAAEGADGVTNTGANQSEFPQDCAQNQPSRASGPTAPAGLYENPDFDDLFERALLDAYSDDSSDSVILSWRNRDRGPPVPPSANDAFLDSQSERSEVLSGSQSDLQERLRRSSRAPSFRQEENSYRSRDLPTPPPTEAIIPLDEITIHQSQPVQLPVSAAPSRAGDELPDAPVSAHIHAPSGGSIVSNTGSTQGTLRYRPLPSIPQPQREEQELKGRSMNPSAAPFVFASPAKTDETYPQTTGDTFASAAYQTADGSPLVPTRTLFEDSIIRPYRPLPDIPAPRQPEPTPDTANAEPTIVSTAEVEGIVACEEVQEESSSDDEVTLLIYPQVRTQGRRKQGFSRSAAPSPDLSDSQIELQLHPQAHIEHQELGHLPGATDVDPDVDDSANDERDERNFRQWAFPLDSSVSDRSSSKPSITRRHTMTEIEVEDSSEQRRMGVASALATRVGELRTHLRPGESDGARDQKQGQEPFRRTSVEFLLRDENKQLGVVNMFDNAEESGLHNTASSEEDRARTPVVNQSMNNGFMEIVQILKRREDAEEGLKEALKSWKEDLATSIQNTFASAKSKSVNAGAIERVTSILEEHSQLLASFQARNTTDLQPEDDDGDAGLDQPRSKEIVAAILTGQHAILEKFDEVASAHNDDTLQLHQAISALREQQAAAIRATDAKAEHEAMMQSLKTELEDARISISESRAQADVLRQRLVDTRQDRDDLRQELDATKSRLGEAQMNRRRVDGEVDGVVARALAAELERDALARAVSDGREEEESLWAELRGWKQELEREKETSRLALAEKESEIVAVQAQLHAHLSLAREQQQQEATARSREPSASASGLAELSQAAVTFQEDVMARFGKLDEHMHESMRSRVKEYEAVLDRNRILQGEVDGLRGRLEDSADRFARLQLNTANSLSKSEVDHKSLSDKLEAEQSRRMEVEAKLESMAKEFRKAKEEKLNHQLIAAQLEATNRQNEIRFQALTQENVYWRQFALEHDRRRFKNYLSSQPFKGIRPSASPLPPPGPQATSSTAQETAGDRGHTGAQRGGAIHFRGEEGMEVNGGEDEGDLTPRRNALGLVENENANGGANFRGISVSDAEGGTWYAERS
ncbi:hypothetical protein IAT40_007516 [Kwoniella sp. CBS 6097]